VSFDPNALLISLLLGAIGFVALSYGRKQGRPPQVIVGLLLMVFPYFVSSIALMIAIAVLLLSLLWLAVRLGW
jgi:ABC-type spermidine/putrescine transport system permease subunit II